MSLKVEVLLALVGALFVTLGSPTNGFPQKTEDTAFNWLLGSETWTSKDPATLVPQETFSECGGVVPVTDSLSIIDYKPSGGIPAHARCVWILHANLSSIGVYFDTFRLPAGAGLSIFYIRNNFTAAMDIYKVPPVEQSEYVVAQHFGHVYLAFSSNTVGGGEGEGFRLGVRVSGNSSSVAVPGFSAHYRPTPGFGGGMASHNGQYENNEYSAVVVQPPPRNASCSTTVAGVSMLDSEDHVDNLDIYVLVPYHSAETSVERSGRFSGYHRYGPLYASTNSTEPRVFTFSTDGSITFTGFTLIWRCEAAAAV